MEILQVLLYYGNQWVSGVSTSLLTMTLDSRPEIPRYGNLVNIPGEGRHDLYINILPTVFNLIFGTLGTLALILLFVGGARAVISRGNPEEFKKAMLNLVFVSIGLIIMGLAYTIVRMIVNIRFA